MTALPFAQKIWIALVLTAVLVAQIDAPYPETAYLHHAPTFLTVIAAPWLLRRWPLSDRAVGCLAVFLLLHPLGGRYTYSNVPYDAWGRALTGGSIDAALGWTRNQYDRLVHFGFGLLIAPVAAEILARRLGMRHARWFALEFVLAAGALYELFEWGLSMVAVGPLADDYNGQQGDVWDAQKDMALAALGALAGLALIGRADRSGGQQGDVHDDDRA